MAEQFETGLRGYSSGGRLNTKHRWDPDDIIDTADRLEMTVFSGDVVYGGSDTCEVTLRGASKFKPAADEKLLWSLKDSDGGKARSGEIVVSDKGFCILPAVLFSKPARLVLQRAAK